MAEQVERLTDESILLLNFLQGISTRDAVSNLSGRGVGMDVVKSNVERIGGIVDVHSTAGSVSRAGIADRQNCRGPPTPTT